MHLLPETVYNDTSHRDNRAEKARRSQEASDVGGICGSMYSAPGFAGDAVALNGTNRARVRLRA